MSKTKILHCACVHPDQDKRYGNGRRVHNAGKKTSGGTPYACTVCGRSIDVADNTKEK